jgi:hypothetical protein
MAIEENKEEESTTTKGSLMPEMEAEDFLELLWNGEGWVDLPAKVNGYWIPYPLEWPPEDDTGISRRIDQSLRDEEDLYFSVARFAERGRALEKVLPVSWLWADLDEVHPSAATAMGLMPTIAVESSPGRYQAYWRLTKELAPKTIEKLNRALTYALGADKGGWDLTQVLRVLGTRNFKYKGAPRVKLMYHHRELVYKAGDVWAKVKEAVPEAELAGVTGTDLPRKPIPRKAKQLLWAKAEEVVEGERSDRLWELNCLLAESGLDEGEIFAMVNVSVWNKWKGNQARLRGDIRKAITHVRRKAVKRDRTKDRAVDSKPSVPADRGASDRDADRDAGDGDADTEDDGDATARLKFVGYSTFMAMPMAEPKWLVRDIWTAGSHGIIGGEPKTSKTTLALALALSVAGGVPFLGQYPVGTQGPVLMIQEENDLKLMQRRMHQLAAHSGLISTRDARVRPASPGGLGSTIVSVDMPAEIPLWMMNKCRFDLADEAHRDFLEGYIEQIRPALVILDPMYLIFGPVDANSMRDLQPFLKWIIGLGTEYGCATALVHHMGKASESNAGRRAGQRLLGSATLHGFTDSALYTTKLVDEREGWTKVSIEREFRAVSDQKPLEMAWHFGESLDVSIEVGEAQDIEGRIVEMMGERERMTLTQLSKETGVRVETLKRRIAKSDLLDIESQGRGKSQMVFLVGLNGGDPNQR